MARSFRAYNSPPCLKTYTHTPDKILSVFQPYYQTAELTDVSNPQLVFDLFEKLRARSFSSGRR